MDNVATPETPVDNQNTQVPPASETPAAPVAQKESSFTWKNNLTPDLKGSPMVGKFSDDATGLAKALESYANLEKLLGHEKVPVPKDLNDKEAWDRFSKAFSIPDKPDGYKLDDPQLPEEMKGLSFDKAKFAEVVHGLKLTPAQAKGLWETYNKIQMDTYTNHLKGLETKVNDAITSLRNEWGQSFDVNVQLGQTVIDKFADSQEAKDYITATLVKDPMGAKFLAKIGEQFAENKVPDFQVKRFSVDPSQAMEEIQSIIRNPDHPYNSPKATDAEHEKAVEYVNSLYKVVNRLK